MDNNSEMIFLAPGTKLNGRYVIERVIGQGGFGITYYAKHEILDHAYAIKEFYISGHCSRNTAMHTVILQGMDENMYEKYKQRFIEEAKTVVALNHPNIVKVVDVFEENNTAYMVMSFIEGTSLQKMVENNHGPLPYELTVNYMGQLSDAVAYIHSKHILHRDIKPDNVLITPDNKAMLIDFGSAREFVNDKTQRHTSILTQGYAPLEQYNSVSRKGNYTDIYALGGVYYFCLTGTTPADATARLLEVDTGNDPLKQPKDINPNVTDAVNHTIMKAMELKPENRYQTVAEFQNDLLGYDDALPMPDDQAEVMTPETSNTIEVKDTVTVNNPAPTEISSEANNQKPKKEKKKVARVFRLLTFVFITITLALIVALIIKNERLHDARWNADYYFGQYSYYYDKANEAERQSQNYKDEAEEAKSKINSIGDTYPMIIKDIKIANTYSNGNIETDYGNTIYSSRTMYLKPKIYYDGIVGGSKTLKVKLYEPNGSLSRGTNSPSGYSYSSSVYLYSDNNNTVILDGWGTDSYWSWSSGTYRIEIWYENTCLKTKTFTIY